MTNLNFTKEELINIFPRDLDNLSVEFLDGNGVNVIYFQKDTFDSRRDWDRYESYLRAKKEISANPRYASINLKLPYDFDILYDENYSLIKNGKFSKNDKLLLNVVLKQKGSRIFLDEIVRNMGEDLRGLGREYCSSLENALFKKGFTEIEVCCDNSALYRDFLKKMDYEVKDDYVFSKSLIL